MASKRIVFSAVVCFGMSAAISAASNETVEWQRMIDAAASAIPGGVSFLRDVLVENVRWTGDASASAARLPIVITGVPGHPVENVTLRNVSVPFVPTGMPGDEKRVLTEKERSYPEAMMFGRYPVWGLYARHVRGLNLESVDLRMVGDGDQRAERCFLDVERLAVSKTK